jgi:hypothetical protein
MHQLIATYLFQHNYCPLPGLGHLYIQTLAAQTDFLNKQIISPQASIQFSKNEKEPNAFLDYVSKTLEESTETVKEKLQNFLVPNHVAIHGVGHIAKENGNIVFESIKTNDYFTTPVIAQRVVHENEAHAMMVGDTETTTTAMTAYYAEDETPKDYWWVWALVLGLLAIAAICVHYFVLI